MSSRRPVFTQRFSVFPLVGHRTNFRPCSRRNRADGHRKHVHMAVEIYRHRGGHLRAKDKLPRRAETDNYYVIHDIVANLRLGMNRCDCAREFVVSIRVYREMRLLASADVADVGFIHVGP
jgi:hypothetical protein